MAKGNDLSGEIMKCLQEYTEEVVEALEKTEKELADEAVRTLKQTSPKKSGKYARSWTQTKQGKKRIVHNRRYQLTHLLEKGHAKRNGGRVAARVHIAPVEQRISKEAVERFKENLK